jgi:hypothetical protein
MKYIRLLYPFAGAVAGTILTIPDDSADAVVKNGIAEIVGQEAETEKVITAPQPTLEPPPAKKKKSK